jgi:uncharacterized protein YecT (DUF1311 family)
MHKTVAVLCSLVIAGLALATQQSDTKPKKVLTPEQQAYQEVQAERGRLRAAAKWAFDAEMAREKAGDCPAAQTTYDFNMCYSMQNSITEENYKAYTGALRALLGLEHPLAPEDKEGPLPPRPAGPQLTPKEDVAEFDKTESLWAAYKEAECTVAFHQFGGGTGGPSAGTECRLRLTRSHMRDLDSVYLLLHL